MVSHVVKKTIKIHLKFVIIVWFKTDRARIVRDFEIYGFEQYFLNGSSVLHEFFLNQDFKRYFLFFSPQNIVKSLLGSKLYNNNVE